MAQTALTKAIEQIKQNRVIEIRPYIYLEAMNDVVKLLTDLLPYERETIESAYSQGKEDESDTWVANEPKFTDRNDYFTKTYNKND